MVAEDSIGRGQIFGDQLLGLRGMGICLIAGKFWKEVFSDTPYCVRIPWVLVEIDFMLGVLSYMVPWTYMIL